MAKAKGSGRKGVGYKKVGKIREVKPDGAHAYSWAYQAKIADALAEKRDAERTAEAALAAAGTAQTARCEKAKAEAAAEARHRAKLAPRPCLRCQAVLPPEAFERHYRSYNGRMGCCRPCAQLIRGRKAAPVGRRPRDLPRRVPAEAVRRHFRPRTANCSSARTHAGHGIKKSRPMLAAALSGETIPKRSDATSSSGG